MPSPIEDARIHLRSMAPHVKERKTAKLLEAVLVEVDRLTDENEKLVSIIERIKQGTDLSEVRQSLAYQATLRAKTGTDQE